MAWTDVLLDATIPLRWLLEIDHAGVTRRFANTPCTYAGEQYAAVLSMQTAPAQTVDIYNAMTTATRCAVVLSPDPVLQVSSTRNARACDLEDAFGVPMIGSAARVYRYGEGTEHRETVIDGVIVSASADPSGSLSLGVEDFSVLYARKRLPDYVVTVAQFPSVVEDAVDTTAPMVYGAFTGLAVPNINPTDDKAIIGHPIYSVSGGQPGTPTLSNQAASGSYGAYALLDYAVDTGMQGATVDGVGMIDTTDKYVGYGLPLLNIADQLLHLGVEVVGIPLDKFDTATFGETRLAHRPIGSTIIFTADEDVDYFTRGNEASSPFGTFLYHERGKVALRKASFARTVSIALRPGEYLRGLTGGIEWSGYEFIPAGIDIRYRRAWNFTTRRDEFTRRRTVLPSEYPPFARAETYGGQMRKMEFPQVHSEAMAEFIVGWLRELYAKTRRKFSVRVSREASDVRLLDVVRATIPEAPGASGFVDRCALVVGTSVDLEGATLDLVEC